MGDFESEKKKEHRKKQSGLYFLIFKSFLIDK